MQINRRVWGASLTCHPLGIRYPSYSISSIVFLNPPNMGGIVRRVSIATLQVYFIFPRSSHVSNSPESLLLLISSCSANDRTRNSQESFFLIFQNLRKGWRRKTRNEERRGRTFQNRIVYALIICQKSDDKSNEDGGCVVPCNHNEHDVVYNLIFRHQFIVVVSTDAEDRKSVV